MTPNTARPTALVTGATAGLGAEFARQLAEKGNNLVLVARDTARLQAAADELQRRYGTTAEVLTADLTDDGGVAAVVGRLSDPSRPVDLLVNNAGIGLLHNFDENPIEDERKHLKLHVQTAMELSHAALQGMLCPRARPDHQRGQRGGFPARGSYSAAKAWLLSFSRWANLAYSPRGVKVTAVCPGFVHTEFHDRMGMDKSVAPGWTWLRPGRVVREALADNERGKAVSIPTKRYKVLAAVVRVVPDRFTAGPPRRPQEPGVGSGASG
jgi:short-subunit dehydrogenase